VRAVSCLASIVGGIPRERKATSRSIAFLKLNRSRFESKDANGGRELSGMRFAHDNLVAGDDAPGGCFNPQARTPALWSGVANGWSTSGRGLQGISEVIIEALMRECEAADLGRIAPPPPPITRHTVTEAVNIG